MGILIAGAIVYIMFSFLFNMIEFNKKKNTFEERVFSGIRAILFLLMFILLINSITLGGS